MPTPCYKDDRFFGSAAQMHRAKRLCAECPAKAHCLELGIGEKEGVWGGTTPTDPVRKSFRQWVDRSNACVNGHPKDLYGYRQQGPGWQDIECCSYCDGLQLRIMELVS